MAVQPCNYSILVVPVDVYYKDGESLDFRRASEINNPLFSSARALQNAWYLPALLSSS
jgi:hypothetical protein